MTVIDFLKDKQRRSKRRKRNFLAKELQSDLYRQRIKDPGNSYKRHKITTTYLNEEYDFDDQYYPDDL